MKQSHIILLLILSYSTNLNSATCTTTAPGVWDCGVPSGSDDLIVNHDVTIAGDFTLTGSIIVNAGTLTFTGVTVTADGASTITVNNGGNMQVNNELHMRGTSFLVISVGGSIQIDDDLEMYDTSSVTISGDMYVINDLELMDGAQTLVVDSTATLTIDDDLKILDTAGTATFNGTITVADEFEHEGTGCGTGTLTYGACLGSGTICGNPGWCDGSGAVPLPVELLEFNARKNENFVDLSWITVAEWNNDFFTIERSTNAIYFETLIIVDGAGSSNNINEYRYMDINPYTGISYYRLKQTDFNGEFTYSDTKAVNIGELEIITLSPNPAVNHIDVLFYSSEETKINVNIYNMLGLSIKEINQMAVAEGGNKFQIDVSSLSMGYYMLEVSTKSGLYRSQKKLVKK